MLIFFVNRSFKHSVIGVFVGFPNMTSTHWSFPYWTKWLVQSILHARWVANCMTIRWAWWISSFNTKVYKVVGGRKNCTYMHRYFKTYTVHKIKQNYYIMKGRVTWISLLSDGQRSRCFSLPIENQEVRERRPTRSKMRIQSGSRSRPDAFNIDYLFNRSLVIFSFLFRGKKNKTHGGILSRPWFFGPNE